MLEFLIQVLTRWLSGVKQSYLYQKKWYEGAYFSILMLAVYLAWASLSGNNWSFLVLLGLAVTYYILHAAFRFNHTKKIHTLEYLGNYVFNFGAFFCGGDLLGLIFAIYVGDFVFNLPIQKHFTGRYLNKVSITDDPTGKTTNFYLWGKERKFPNLFTSGYSKMYAAIACTLVYGFIYYMGWHLTINDITAIFK